MSAAIEEHRPTRCDQRLTCQTIEIRRVKSEAKQRPTLDCADSLGLCREEMAVLCFFAYYFPRKLNSFLRPAGYQSREEIFEEKNGENRNNTSAFQSDWSISG